MTNSIHGVYVMPDLTFYWYGFERLMSDATLISGPDPVKSTNTVELKAVANALTGVISQVLDYETAGVNASGVTKIGARYFADRSGNTNDGQITHNDLALATRSSNVSDGETNCKLGIRIASTFANSAINTTHSLFVKSNSGVTLGEITSDVSFSGKQLGGQTVKLHALWLE